MTENTLPPVKLAFVLDGEVADILHTDERLAAIFSSNPTVVNVTTFVEANDPNVVVGSSYNSSTGEFMAPAPAQTPTE